MLKISAKRIDFISPQNPEIKIEIAIECDGTECNRTIYDDDGNLIELAPHLHLVESEDGAGTRTYAITGDIPEETYNRFDH